jgi:hypothetical protein
VRFQQDPRAVRERSGAFGASPKRTGHRRSSHRRGLTDAHEGFLSPTPRLDREEQVPTVSRTAGTILKPTQHSAARKEAVPFHYGGDTLVLDPGQDVPFPRFTCRDVPRGSLGRAAIDHAVVVRARGRVSQVACLNRC